MHHKDDVRAERMCRDLLPRMRKALGSLHPSTLGAVDTLGQLLQTKGDICGACRYLEEAMAGRRGTLGNEHPDVVHSMMSLCSVYSAADRADEAISLGEQALNILKLPGRIVSERTMGIALGNVGSAYLQNDDLAAAKPHLESSSEIFSRICESLTSLADLEFI